MLQFILGTLIVVVLSLCWYMPVYKKAAGPDRVDKKLSGTHSLLA